MSKILREPLFHFLLIGAGLFLLYGLFGNSRESPRQKIVISQGQIEVLAEGWKRTWHRAPTQVELEGLIQDAVAEEVLYREALALNLDKDDTIIRRRLRQKMEFLSEEVSAQVEPSDDQLREFLSRKPESYQIESSISFSQIYLDPERRKGDPVAVELLLKKLNGETENIDAAALGDPIALPGVFVDVPASEVDKQFGPGFAKGLLELGLGAWQGPVKSGFGLHLVKLGERKPGRNPEFSEIREALKRDWLAARRLELQSKLLQGLSEKYSIEVERPEWARAP